MAKIVAYSIIQWGRLDLINGAGTTGYPLIYIYTSDFQED